jgi:hypothetical protein
MSWCPLTDEKDIFQNSHQRKSSGSTQNYAWHWKDTATVSVNGCHSLQSEDHLILIHAIQLLWGHVTEINLNSGKGEGSIF